MSLLLVGKEVAKLIKSNFGLGESAFSICITK